MFGERFLIRTIDWVVALVEILLGLRIILKLLGANPATPFVQWTYDTTQPLLEPFEGIFPTQTISRGNVLEFSALFAVIIYALLGYLLQSLIANIVTATEETVED